MGPNLADNITGVFWAAFLLFSWTTASIMSGAIIERVRLAAYLLLATVLGSVVWILDAAWGWSAGGWLVTEWGFHDAIASGVVHGVAGAFTLGVLLQLGPRIGKYSRTGRPRNFLPHNLHLTLLGLMLIFTGFYAFYAACLVIQSTVFPGWANIYLSPSTLSAITFTITIAFAGGFTGGYFASRGDPFWVLSGGLAGVISVSAGADVYHPSLVYLIATATGAFVVFVGAFIERTLRIDDVVGAVAVHGVAGFLGMFFVGIFAAGYPTGLENVESSLGGQMMGIMTFFPLGFLPGYFIAWGLRKVNMLRVPPEVELEASSSATSTRSSSGSTRSWSTSTARRCSPIRSCAARTTRSSTAPRPAAIVRRCRDDRVRGQRDADGRRRRRRRVVVVPPRPPRALREGGTA
jgi:ammonia channel protein AmtB